MIDGQPLVSVIVTAYNRENFLAEAIKSVLDQDYENTEIIVIDDGSTDKTAEIAKSFGSSIVYAFQQNEGVASAVNHGLRLARGELLAFLDSDDLWQEKTLAKRINPFVLDPEIEIVAGYVKNFIDGDISNEDEEKVIHFMHIGEELPGYTAPCLVIRKEVFDRVGLLDIRLKVGSFMDWYLRAQEASIRVHLLPDVVLLRRIHRNNLGRLAGSDQSTRLRILKNAIDRRRNLD